MGEDQGGVAGRLLAALESEAQLVDAGAFTLDPSKAREKLRAYQLVDPHAYLLLMVEAAWLAGPSAIDISCGRESQAVFEGVSLTRSQLENVFTSVFLDTSELDGEVLRAARIQQLFGVAANAALALEPARIEIENVDAQAQLNRMTIERDGSYTCESVGEGMPGRTRFVFTGTGDDSDREEREVALIRARCRLASFPVNVYGQRMSAGPRRAMLGYNTERIRLEDGTTVGLAGLGDDGAKPKLVLLTRGVFAETVLLDDAAPGFVAVADVDLRKDLSQQGVMRGEGFDTVMHAVMKAHAQLTRQ